MFNPDGASNPNVALYLAGSSYLYSDINVTNNLSTGTSTIGVSDASTSYFYGAITLSKDVTLTAAAGGTALFDFSYITGSNNVTVSGPGKVVLYDSAQYTGTTTVNSGTLEVDGTPTYLTTSGITVNGGTLVLGTGMSISANAYSGTIDVGSSGTLALGYYASSTICRTARLSAATTTIAGNYNVKMNIASTGTPTVITSTSASPNYDRIVSTGAININGAHINVSGVSTYGTAYLTSNPAHYLVIAQGSSITGTVASVTTGFQANIVTVGSVQQLQISQAPANSFGTWIAGYPSLTGANATETANPSGDGLTNLVKYALGLNPTVASGVPGTLSSGTLTFNKGTMASGDSNVTYSILESTDLITWTTATTGVTNNSSLISFAMPTGQAKVFARLQVSDAQ